MAFLRPEIAELAHRWREVLSGAAIIAAGGWLSTLGGWFYGGLGGLVALAGLGLAVSGARRLRFRPEGRAPGIVRMLEGQVAYFGPETGGFAALTELEELRLEPRPHGPSWVLVQPAGPLEIPVAAEGAELLHDWFAALPGMDLARLHAALGQPPQSPRLLWRRTSRPQLPR